MVKKWLRALLALIAALCFSLALVACGEGGTEGGNRGSGGNGGNDQPSVEEHTEHSYDEVLETVAPTCTEGGYTVYKCSCGETKRDDFVDPLGHDFVAEGWDWNGFTGASVHLICQRNGAHTQDIPANVRAEGSAEGVCEGEITIVYTATAVLGEERFVDERTETVYGQGHDYDLEHPVWSWKGFESAILTLECLNNPEHREEFPASVEERGRQSASCTEDGYIEYVAVAYLDEMTLESEIKREPLAATGHDYDTEHIQWNWAQDYSSAAAQIRCLNGCNHCEEIAAQVEADRTTSPATCTEDGTAYYTASILFENQTYTDGRSERIFASGHDIIPHEWKEPTCTEAGHNAYDTCSRCDYTTYEEYPASGHSLYLQVWIWADDYSSATAHISCRQCDHTETREVAATAEGQDATCDTDGGWTYAVEIELDRLYTESQSSFPPAFGHDWSVEWVWNGYESATAKLACANDSAHNTELSASIKKNTTRILTCTENGEYEYVATVNHQGRNYTDTKTETVQATGHTEYVYRQGYEATCTNKGRTDGVQCSVCYAVLQEAAEIPALGHDMVAVAEVPATCTAAGQSAYEECSRCHTHTEITELPMAHRFVNGVCTACEKKEPSSDLTYSLYANKYYIVTGLKEGSAQTDLIFPDIYEGKPVEKIGENAFKNNTSLTSITFQGNITVIESNAFSGCTGLQSLDFGAGVKEIGSSAFEGCTGLIAIDFGDCVEKIGNGAFVESILEGANLSLVLPNGLTTLGDRAFWYCTGIVALSWENPDQPVALEKISSLAFDGCTNLGGVLVLPEGVTEIGGGAFRNTAITGVSFPQSLLAIGGGTDSGAFNGCKKLGSAEGYEQLILPERLQRIGGYAFYGCASYTGEVVIPDTVTSFGVSVFMSSGITKLTLPKGITAIQDQCINGFACVAELTIPDTVTAIGMWGLWNLYKLTKIVFTGTSAQWKEIDLDESWCQGVGSDNGRYDESVGRCLFDVVCSDGVVFTYSSDGAQVSDN